MAATDLMEIERTGDVAVVKLRVRELTAHNYPVISQRLFLLLDKEGVHKIILDCDNMAYLFSEAIGLLVALNKRVKNSDCELQLRNMKDVHVELLEASNLLDLFDIEESSGE